MHIATRNVPVALLESAARAGITKSAADPALYGDAVDLTKAGPISAVAFILNVTVAEKEAGDKLDVYVQMSLDGGATYVDVQHFTQILGNITEPVIYYAKINQATALTEFETATALGAAALRNLIGTLMRAKYVTTNDADDPVDTSFTFSLHAVLM